LGEWNGRRVALFFILLGVFWGFWASYWKLEDGYTISPENFAIYAFLSILLLVTAYTVLNASFPGSFELGRLEIGAFTAVPFSVLVLCP